MVGENPGVVEMKYSTYFLTAIIADEWAIYFAN